MKKVLSLILLLALTLSINVFANQSTEVYFSMNFDDYSNVNDFISKFESTSYTPNSGSMSAAGEMLNNSKNVQDVEGATGGIYSVGGGSFSNAYMSFEKNLFGRKTLRTANSSLASNAQAGFIVVPKKSFNFIEKKDEIFIISYDLDVNGGGVSTINYHGDQTYWTDPLKEKTLPLNTMYKESNANGGISYRANWSYIFSSGAKATTFSKGNTYRVAYGYGFGNNGAGNEHEDNYNWDTYGQKYYAPSRYYFKDGGAWDGTNYECKETWAHASINGKDKPSHSFNGKNVLYAFTLTWAGDYGVEYGDILAYTVSADPTTFGASIVNNVVELGSSAYVKFSQPIAPKSVTKDAFSITEDGNPYSLYEIGEIKTVVDEATNEVYSVVEISFPYGIKAGENYDITVNSTGTAVKSEIMRNIAFGNTLSFTAGSAPGGNAVSLFAKDGLAGDGSETTNISAGQAKFTAQAVSSETPSYLFIGIYNGTELVSYAYTKATTADILSFASKVEAGYTVKALSCGCLYDLNNFFANTPDINIQ